MKLSNPSYIKGFSDGQIELSDRLLEWLSDEKREPAQTKFTAGAIRNLAREIEAKIKEAENKPPFA